jgi:RNA polymerase sigma-70 factor, ECF subfamily
MPLSLTEESNKPDASADACSDLASEAALVAAAKVGDEQAFEILIKRNQRRIFVVALRYTRVREDAEDVVQQTLQKAFIYLVKFKGKSSFATWLTRIAINESLMVLRRRRALCEVLIEDSSSDDGTAPGLKIADISPDPETSYLQREEADILCAAIWQLRPGLRATIELRDLGELSTREAAQRMGLSVAAVKARVFHGRKKLHEMLKGYVESTWASRDQLSRRGRKANGIARQQLVCGACD